MISARNRLNSAEIKKKVLFEVFFWAGPWIMLLIALLAIFLLYLYFWGLNLAMKVAASWFGCFDERLIMKFTCLSFLVLLLFGISYLISARSGREKRPDEF